MVTEVEITEGEVERWIDGFLRKRYPQLEPQYRKAYTAFRTLARSKRFNQRDFDTIVEAASSKYAACWENATFWLAQLGSDFPQVYPAISEMFRANKPHVRFNALCALSRRAPRKLLVDLVVKGVTDRNARVRWKAVERAERYRILEAIPIIEKQRQVERSKKVISVIDFELPLLRDGYILRNEEGGAALTVAGGGGIRSGHITDGELARQGLKTIIKEWQEELDRSLMRVRYV